MMTPISPNPDKAISAGHIPSGLYIVCAQDATTQRIDGFLASWIQQVSFEPLLISLAMKSTRTVYPLISSGRVFTINITGDHNDEYIKDFRRGYPPDDNPFEKLSLKQGKAGGIIIASARSALECRYHSHMTPGDHVLVIAEIMNSYVLTEKALSRVHLRETGRTY